MNEEFWSKVCKTDTCWLWRGSLNNDGYGRYKMKQVHRISYEELIEKIPAGMIILHNCDTRNCVNPKHLKVGTKHDNMMDASRKGRLLHFNRDRFFPTRTLKDVTN